VQIRGIPAAKADLDIVNIQGGGNAGQYTNAKFLFQAINSSILPKPIDGWRYRRHLIPQLSSNWLQ